MAVNHRRYIPTLHLNRAVQLIPVQWLLLQSRLQKLQAKAQLQHHRARLLFPFPKRKEKRNLPSFHPLIHTRPNRRPLSRSAGLWNTLLRAIFPQPQVMFCRKRLKANQSCADPAIDQRTSSIVCCFLKALEEALCIIWMRTI